MIGNMLHNVNLFLKIFFQRREKPKKTVFLFGFSLTVPAFLKRLNHKKILGMTSEDRFFLIKSKNSTGLLPRGLV